MVVVQRGAIEHLTNLGDDPSAAWQRLADSLDGCQSPMLKVSQEVIDQKGTTSVVAVKYNGESYLHVQDHPSHAKISNSRSPVAVSRHPLSLGSCPLPEGR